MNKYKLKPCPFCGGEVKIWLARSYCEGKFYKAWVRCETCNTEMVEPLLLDDEDLIKRILSTRWNKRTT